MNKHFLQSAIDAAPNELQKLYIILMNCEINKSLLTVL